MQNKRIYEILKQVILENEIYDQETIVEILQKKYFVTITQSSLSRRLNKIGIAKSNGRYTILQDSAVKSKISITVAPPNIIIVKTPSGYASAVATNLDNHIENRSEKSKGMLATIAGDDTIAVIIDINVEINSIISNIKTITS